MREREGVARRVPLHPAFTGARRVWNKIPAVLTGRTSALQRRSQSLVAPVSFPQKSAVATAHCHLCLPQATTTVACSLSLPPSISIHISLISVYSCIKQSIMSSFGSNKRSRNNDNDVERKPLTFEQRKRRLYNQSIRELNAWIEGIYNNWAPKLEKPQSGTKPSEESQRAENQLTFFTYEYDRVHKSVTDTYQRPTGDVIFMGSNDMRQLGRTDEVEDEDEQNLPNYPPVFMQLLHSLKFISLAAGGLHTAALTKDGNVYTWGPNDEGATGRPRGSTPAPTLVQGFYPHYAPNDESAKEDGQIMDVQAGNTSLIYLTINGNVYTSGSYRTVNDKIRDIPRDKQGRFTDADPFEPNWGPIHIPLPQKARLIRAGDNFFVAQLADGTLWTWGTSESSLPFCTCFLLTQSR